MTPRLSVLLPAMGGYEETRAAVSAWEGQTARRDIELLVLVPGPIASPPEDVAPSAPGHIVVPVGEASMHEARAIGVGLASGEYVVVAEDHCLPDPDWAEAILRRLDDGWDGIAPALRPGNRVSCWGEGGFLLGYGEWMMPITSGPTHAMCGWNGTIRTEVLRRYGGDLASELVLGAFLVKKLRGQGCRYYLEADARMRHFDHTSWMSVLRECFVVGMGFGAFRTEDLGRPARWSYPLAVPAIAALHCKRALKQYHRAGRACGMRWSSVAAAVVCACAWAVGEAAGALVGRRRVAPILWHAEVKPPSPAAVARSDETETLLGWPR